MPASCPLSCCECGCIFHVGAVRRRRSIQGHGWLELDELLGYALGRHTRGLGRQMRGQEGGGEGAERRGPLSSMVVTVQPVHHKREKEREIKPRITRAKGKQIEKEWSRSGQQGCPGMRSKTQKRWTCE